MLHISEKHIPAVINPGASGIDSDDAQQLVSSFLSGKSPLTLRAYRQDILDFAGFVGVADLDQASHFLLSQGSGKANVLALQYLASLEGRGLTPATTRRRISALKSLCRFARMLGLVTWQLEVKPPKAQTFKDTRGSGLDGYRKLLAAARSHKNEAKAARDVAMLRLMGDRGLRRSEVALLDISDLDLEGERVAVQGKGGHGGKELLTLASETIKAIKEWLAVRHDLGTPFSGPLFLTFDRRSEGKRIQPDGIYRVLRRLGAISGVKRWQCHGLRHHAVTMVLECMGGNLRAAQVFARHKDPKTTLLYDDNLEDIGGKATKVIAAMVG